MPYKNWTCHQRPLVLRGHVFVAEPVVYTTVESALIDHAIGHKNVVSKRQVVFSDRFRLIEI